MSHIRHIYLRIQATYKYHIFRHIRLHVCCIYVPYMTIYYDIYENAHFHIFYMCHTYIHIYTNIYVTYTFGYISWHICQSWHICKLIWYFLYVSYMTVAYGKLASFNLAHSVRMIRIITIFTLYREWEKSYRIKCCCKKYAKSDCCA